MIIVLIAAVVSAIVSKIIAVHTFNVIDDYVKDVVDMAKESIRNAHFNKREDEGV